MRFRNLDPSAYASDSSRKLWETVRRRSQDLAIWALQRMLFNSTKTFCFFYIYVIARFRAPSELELKKRSLQVPNALEVVAEKIHSQF